MKKIIFIGLLTCLLAGNQPAQALGLDSVKNIYNKISSTLSTSKAAIKNASTFMFSKIKDMYYAQTPIAKHCKIIFGLCTVLTATLFPASIALYAAYPIIALCLQALASILFVLQSAYLYPTLSIFLHEFGHFLACKLLNVPVFKMVIGNKNFSSVLNEKLGNTTFQLNLPTIQQTLAMLGKALSSIVGLSSFDSKKEGCMGFVQHEHTYSALKTFLISIAGPAADIAVGSASLLGIVGICLLMLFTPTAMAAFLPACGATLFVLGTVTFFNLFSGIWNLIPNKGPHEGTCDGDHAIEALKEMFTKKQDPISSMAH